MNKITAISLCLIVSLSLAGCFSSQNNKVMNYYEKYIEEIKVNIQEHFEKGEELIIPSKDITVNEWSGEHTIVEYTLTGMGASQYSGFFYSKDNVPVSFQNSGEKLSEVSENEWKWQGNGDNRGLIRQIEPYWYYFEASL